MDGGAWWAAVHGVAKSWTRLSDFTFTFYFHALEKEMATHSSVLAWRIPGMGEPGGLPSMGSHRVGHDRSDLAAAIFACYIFFHHFTYNMFSFCFIEGGGFMTLGGIDESSNTSPLCYTRFSSLDKYYRVQVNNVQFGSERAYLQLNNWNK